MSRLSGERSEILSAHIKNIPKNQGSQVSLKDGTNNALNFIKRTAGTINKGLKILTEDAASKIKK